MVHLRNMDEVRKIRQSSRIAAEVLRLLGDMIEPGMTPKKLDSEAEKYIRSRHAEPGFKGLYGYPATLCVSVEHEVVHGIPSDLPLREGQIVGLDVGALKDGYYSDHARTFAVGKIDQAHQDLITRTKECLDLGIKVAVAGGTVGDIGHAVQQHAEEVGYGVVRELVGHGIGTRLHEEPQIPNYGRPGQGAVIREGMCLAIEPMINIGSREVVTQDDGWTVTTADGKPSAHFEHTIVITSNGPEVLTAYEVT
ncbi:MAG: type I methionyl aminopeptidase [Candidatus Marinimicrobia bacterium]|nr:type I methionyl aminopeptidase [Candidatus Neomarinimicrobiota bacterium]